MPLNVHDRRADGKRPAEVVSLADRRDAARRIHGNASGDARRVIGLDASGRRGEVRFADGRWLWASDGGAADLVGYHMPAPGA